MLAPEVINFALPKSLDYWIDGDLKIEKLVSKQYFNNLVTITLPDAMFPPDSVVQALSDDSDYYHIYSVPVHELVNSQFINIFIKNGSLTLHSVSSRLDQDNCIGILPTGVLVMSLNKDTFQCLGLEGTKSEFMSEKFVVKIDLKSSELTSCSKRYKRIVDRLKAIQELTSNIIMSWEPKEQDVCPSSIAAWFAESYRVEVCSTQLERKTHYSLNVPSYKKDEMADIIEWAGMIHLQCETNPSHPCLSSYETPSPNILTGQVLTLQWKGLLTAKRVNEAVKKLKESVNKSSSSWALMTIHGMDDSVTTHGEKEHHFYVEGEYSISVVMAPEATSSALVHISSSGPPVGRRRAS